MIVGVQLPAIGVAGKIGHQNLANEGRVGDGQSGQCSSVKAVDGAKAAEVPQFVFIWSSVGLVQGEAKGKDGPRTRNAPRGPVAVLVVDVSKMVEKL